MVLPEFPGPRGSRPPQLVPQAAAFELDKAKLQVPVARGGSVWRTPLVNRLRADLPASDVAELADRTEGWSAGLYLAALSREGGATSEPPTEPGDGRHVVDYPRLLGYDVEQALEELDDHLVPIRVALADDNLLVREGLEQLLAAETGIEVVASCVDLPSLLAAVEAERPDVVLTDIRMPPSQGDEGIRAATILRGTHPEIGVIVLSQFDDPDHVLALLERGSDRRGYMLKERIHDRAQLVDAIEKVDAGGSAIDPRIVDVLVAARSRGDTSPLATLTQRELEVLSQIAQGKSNSAIAASLVVTKGAVEKHTNSIFLKLGLSDAEDVSKRVKASLLFLADENQATGAGGVE